MLSSLRAKLVASFVAVIFLTVFLVSGAFAYVVREHQAALAISRLADLAVSMNVQVRALEHTGATTQQIRQHLREQAAEAGVRALLVDGRGRVVEDTGSEAREQWLESIPTTTDRPLPGGGYWGTYSTRAGERFYFVAPTGRPPLIEELIRPRLSYRVLVFVPHQTVSAAWLDILPRLSVAATLSLVLSLIVALVLSRSISRPIAEITAASERIARGKYDQSVRVSGNDEIARLGRAFNTMASEVARSHRTLRGFLADVSHELRTPLTSILGFSEAMIDGTVRDEEGYRSAGAVVREEAERMQRLVDDLLYLSKLEAGQLRLDLHPLDLADLARASARRVIWRAEKQGITVVVQEDTTPTIMGDVHRIEQALANLLDNALKYTPSGGKVTLRVTAEGARAAVYVHNTGSYIAPDELARVFDRFYRTNQDGPEEGSGLGLAIVKQIAGAHGGSVEATSAEQAGTTFVLRLPLGFGRAVGVPPAVNPTIAEPA